MRPPLAAVCGIGERSWIKLRQLISRICLAAREGLLLAAAGEVVIRDFHPLVFFYALGILITVVGFVLGVVEVVLRLVGNEVTTPTIVLVALLLISGSQSRSPPCGSTWSRKDL